MTSRIIADREAFQFHRTAHSSPYMPHPAIRPPECPGRDLDIVVSRHNNGGMKQVGVRELKARLSQFLREVAKGEIVEVTDRGKIVAELRPPGYGATESIFEARFRLWAREGKLIPASKPPGRGAFSCPLDRPLPPGSAREILDDLREERHVPGD